MRRLREIDGDVAVGLRIDRPNVPKTLRVVLRRGFLSGLVEVDASDCSSVSAERIDSWSDLRVSPESSGDVKGWRALGFLAHQVPTHSPIEARSALRVFESGEVERVPSFGSGELSIGVVGSWVTPSVADRRAVGVELRLCSG